MVNLLLDCEVECNRWWRDEKCFGLCRCMSLYLNPKFKLILDILGPGILFFGAVGFIRHWRLAQDHWKWILVCLFENKK